MVGFYSGDPLDSPGVDAEGTAAVPATAGQVAGASISEAFEGGATPRLLRQAERVSAPSTPDPTDPRIPQSFFGDPTASTAGAPTADVPKMSADEANARYGIKGSTPDSSLTFKDPIPDSAAADLYNHQRAENLRQDTLSRAAPGILTSAPARLAYGLAGGAMDPSNIAMALIPGIGEANEARIAASLGDGFVGRTVARGVSGAVAGAGQMAALEPLNYALDQGEGKEWSMGDAARNIAWGSVLGGGLHVLGGTVHDALGRTVPTDPIGAAVDRMDPEAQQQLVRGAVAQAMEDRPVDVAPAFDLFQAKEAQEELQGWAGQQERIDADTDTALQSANVPDAPDLSARIGKLQDRLSDLRDQSAAFRGDLDGTAEQTTRNAFDPETAQRMGDLEQELGGVIPSQRRASLENERTMLLEGRGQTDVRMAVASGDLDVARGQAEQRGLAAAADRIDTQAAPIDAKLQALQAQDALAKQQVKSARAIAGRTLDIQSAKIGARESMVHALATRTIRRFAGANGFSIAPGEAEAYASRILRGKEDPRAVLGDVVRTKSLPGKFGFFDGGDPIQMAMEPLRRHAADASRDLVASTRYVDQQKVAEGKFADEAAKTQAPGKPSDDLAKVQQHVADLEAQMFPKPRETETEAAEAGISAADGSEEKAPALPPEIHAAQTLVDTAEKRAAGMDAIAACPGVIGA